MKDYMLVTGGAGFIGSHVAQHLLNAGYHVIVLDDLSGGYRENIPAGATFIQGSITDAELINNLFATTPISHIFHLAAYAAEGLSHFIRHYNYTNNLLGSVNLINAAVRHSCKCFVFTSSIAVYGAGQTPMSEAMTPRPEDPYGISKLAIEYDLEAAHRMFGLNYIIFRPHNVYGERQNLADPYRNVVGIFMRQVLTREPLTIFGDGNQTRAFSYIDDVAPVIADSISRPDAFNTVYNIGASEPRTVNDVAKIVCSSFGAPLTINYQAARNEVMHAYSSHDKVSQTFHIEPQWRLEDGVARMTNWARTAPLLALKKFADIELTQNLPPVWKAKYHAE